MKRPFLAPLVPLYATATLLRERAYDHRLIGPSELQYPVISIGNLAAGGSGKTPLVIRLAHLLRQRGITVDVLSRGYGRTNKATLQVDPQGTADNYGDEPLLIARTAGIPVYVGRSRFDAGVMAEQNLSNTSERVIHLLDDGFQHRQLARSLDIVLVNRGDLTDSLLPAGDLREPFSALHRANILAIRQDEQEILSELRRQKFLQPVWLVNRSVTIPSLEGTVLAFCGIARPDDFFASLRIRGIQLAAQIGFPDHHHYKSQDANRLRELARRYKASSFLTTEKDLVRLDKRFLNTLQSIAPIHTARLETTIAEEDCVVEDLLFSLGF
jgi:tetraacyldisaccharide 4'-kinase